jgi:hypothetical protein
MGWIWPTRDPYRIDLNNSSGRWLHPLGCIHCVRALVIDCCHSFHWVWCSGWSEGGECRASAQDGLCYDLCRLSLLPPELCLCVLDDRCPLLLPCDRIRDHFLSSFSWRQVICFACRAGITSLNPTPSLYHLTLCCSISNASSATDSCVSCCAWT